MIPILMFMPYTRTILSLQHILTTNSLVAVVLLSDHFQSLWRKYYDVMEEVGTHTSTTAMR